MDIIFIKLHSSKTSEPDINKQVHNREYLIHLILLLITGYPFFEYCKHFKPWGYLKFFIGIPE